MPNVRRSERSTKRTALVAAYFSEMKSTPNEEIQGNTIAKKRVEEKLEVSESDEDEEVQVAVDSEDSCDKDEASNDIDEVSSVTDSDPDSDSGEDEE
jgi:hypothetical protein